MTRAGVVETKRGAAHPSAALGGASHGREVDLDLDRSRRGPHPDTTVGRCRRPTDVERLLQSNRGSSRSQCPGRPPSQPDVAVGFYQCLSSDVLPGPRKCR
jgi:hypothetical protein